MRTSIGLPGAFVLCFVVGILRPAQGVERPENCKPVAIRQAGDNECVTKTFAGHNLILEYFTHSYRSWQPFGTISITSWYNEATVQYRDLLGDGKKEAVVQFEGNVGTGVHQEIVAIIGWRNGKFRLCVLEGLSYYVESERHVQDLTVKYEFVRSKHGPQELRLKYSYTIVAGSTSKKGEWEDVLHWDNDKFAYCGQLEEATPANDEISRIRERIQSIRARVCEKGIEPRIIDLDFLGKIGVLNILDVRTQ